MTHIDEIIRSRRKTMVVILYGDGRVVVRAPLKASDAQIRAFIAEKSAWIARKQQQVAAMPPAAPKTYTPGEQFLFLGQPHPLQLVTAGRAALTFSAGIFLLRRDAQPRAEEIFTRWYRQQAQRVFTERAALYAARHRLQYERIRISAARTRWGSCSSIGTLSFTWRLVLAPLPVIDYVVVHELAHTLEHNHAKPFWQLVQAMQPEYSQHRAWLKANGRFLTL